MDVMDIFGIVFVAIIFLGSLVVSFYMFVYFSHPLDKDFPGVWVFRLLIVLGMTVAFMMIFLMPVDYLSAYQSLVN